jgi:hypothetical protein
MHPAVSRFALEDSRSPFLWSSAIVLVNITSGLTGHSTVTHCCSSGPPANVRPPHRRPRRRHPPHPDPSVASRPSIATPASAMARGVSRRWGSRPPTTEGRPRPAAGASWRPGGGGQSKEGGEVGKHERQADLHLQPSGRPAIAGGSTGQRRRRAFSLRRQQAVPGKGIRVHCPPSSFYTRAVRGGLNWATPRFPSWAVHRTSPAGHSRTAWLLHAQEVLRTPLTFEKFRNPLNFKLALRLLSIYIFRLISDVYL